MLALWHVHDEPVVFVAERDLAGKPRVLAQVGREIEHVFLLSRAWAETSTPRRVDEDVTRAACAAPAAVSVDAGHVVVDGSAHEGGPDGDFHRVGDAIEAGVREAPEQYMWTYKRFKQRPPGAPPLYG